jgi:hypothetical protein
MLDPVLNLGAERRVGQGLASETKNNAGVGLYQRFDADVQQYRPQHQEGFGDESSVKATGVRTTPSSASGACRGSRRLQGLCGSRARRAARQAIAPSLALNGGARPYQRINRIPTIGDGGQRAADGVRRKGDSSGSGVAFSRDEVTGAPEPSGDFLINAQGEDVVSGVRNTLDISDLERVLPGVYGQLMGILRTLERHYGDMQDTEFTVEEGRLYMLQTRNAKRPAQAAVRFRSTQSARLLDKTWRSPVDPGPLDAARPSTRGTRCSRPGWPPRRGRRSARSSSPRPTRLRRRPMGAT